MKKILSILISIYLIHNVNASSDTLIIKDHLINLTKTDKYRNYLNVDQLNKTAEYIFEVFEKYADTVYYQKYIVDGFEYKNVVCDFGSKNEKTIVVGAHYDVCGNQEGADDNASGIAGLLELARLLENQELNYKIELVAFTLEEPPYFRTEYMGSYLHAKSLKDRNIDVFGMLCIEMIGFFSDEKNSQDFPLKILSIFYGKTGDFITLVNQFKKGKFAREFTRKFIRTKCLKTKKFFGPKKLEGVDFSDHLNYWFFGYSALMITDTAFYRNKNYHQSTDTLESLDLMRMSKVIDGIFKTLISL